jgi:hypothetical protein
MPRKLNLVGTRYGTLTVVKEGPRLKDRTTWECVCDCGAVVTRRTSHLRHSNQRFCWGSTHINDSPAVKAIAAAQAPYGHSRGRVPVHGKSYSRAYRIFQAMHRRCYNPNIPQYQDWGGRGIQVCDRWRRNFANFYADMGDPPTNTSLDRIDNDGNYEPSNCRWATRAEQMSNTRRAKRASKNLLDALVVVAARRVLVEQQGQQGQRDPSHSGNSRGDSHKVTFRG